MTPNIEKSIRRAAVSAAAAWGLDPNPKQDAVRDPDPKNDPLRELEQELWLWYLERPGTQKFVADADSDSARQKVFFNAANQILSDRVLQGNTFQGKGYSSESVKDALKGRSTNRYLKDILPLAQTALQAQNEGYREALRSRYDDGLIPEQGAAAQYLTEAHKAITEHVNIIAITAGEISRDAALPETRRRIGVYGDPTADLAVGLVLHGEELLDEESDMTVREAMFSVLDDWFAKPTGGPEGEIHSIFGDDLNALPGGDMYRAQVFPDLFPGEKPMLIDNWPEQDRDMYCGGQYTKGYLRVIK